ncbi:MAG: hypothetical protein Q7R83_01320 [bacterium]|nr:hypothetical protein [bacterium]
MSNFAKKLFSGFVTFATILSTVFMGTLSFAGAASASSFTSGDLIKASTPAVYFYAADGKRYVFPNEKTYFSWYSNFSSVKIITDGELASIMIGGNVTIRPGTKLIKITTDPKVYAVTGSYPSALLHWVETEAVAIALFGANWAKMVVDVPDGFFVNYSVGSSIPTAVHPDGSVITYAGSTDKYVVLNGQKRKLTDAGFAANNLNVANVLSTSVSYPTGSDVTGREDAISNVVLAGGSIANPTAGTLSVALASDTAPTQTVAKSASSVSLFKFTITGGAQASTLTGIKLRDVGMGATTDLANAYVYDGFGNRLTTGRTINSSTKTVEFNGLTLSVPAGQPVSVVIVGDIYSSATAGGQHALELSDASYVTLSSGAVTGSFPVRGNVATIGTVTATAVAMTEGTQPATVTVGSKDVEIASFKINTATNDIEVRRITLLQAGTIANSDITNLKLYQGINVVATAAALVNDKIVLNFTTPFPITAGFTKTFSLHADVSGRADRNIKIYIENNADVYAIDKLHNTGAAFDMTLTTGGSEAYISANAAAILLQGGQLTFAFNGPSAGDVNKGTSNFNMYKFALTAASADLEIKKLYVTVTSTDGGFLRESTTDYFRNVRVVNLDTGKTLMGPTSIPTTVSGLITFTEAFNVAAGQTLNLGVNVDIYNSTDTDLIDNKFRVTVGTGTTLFDGANDVRIISTGEYLAAAKIVPNSITNGNVFTVKSSALSVSLAGNPSSNTVVGKQQGVPTTGLLFSATKGDSTVTSIKVTGYGSTTGNAVPGAALTAGLFDDVVSSCSLWDGDRQVGTSQNPDATSGAMTFSGINWVVSAGSPKTLIVKCNVQTNLSATAYFGVAVAAVDDITAQDADSNSITSIPSAVLNANAGTVQMTVQTGGTLTVATESLAPSTILVADGSTWHIVSQYKFTAQNEAITIDRINVTTTGSAANFSAIAIAQNGAIKGYNELPAGTDQAKDIELTGTNAITVAAGGTASIQVWAKFKAIAPYSQTSVYVSGNSVKAGINGAVVTGNWNSDYAAKYNIHTAGVGSGNTITTGSATPLMGNTFVIRKTKPSVVYQPVSSTLGNGARDLYSMQVKADPNGTLAVKKLSFSMTFSTSSASTLNLTGFKIYRGANEIDASNVVISATGTKLGVGAAGDSMNAETGILYAGNFVGSSVSVTVLFNTEESITAAEPKVYTLRATVAGSATGDQISISPLRNSLSAAVTGYLSDAAATTSAFGAGPILWSAVDTAISGANGTFLWSDMSETPHSDAYGIVGDAVYSSKDWTEDLYVSGLGDSQVLSR